MWQGYMVQKSSRGPRIIGHSNDKNQKFSGTPPRTPLRGRGHTAPPNPQQFCCSLRSHFVASRNYHFCIHLQASLDSGTACLRAGPFTTLPQWTQGSHVRQKIMFAGHDVRQKIFCYFWAWVYTVRYRCLCIISASCLVTSHWTLETLENSVF